MDCTTNYAIGDVVNFELTGPALSSSGDQILAYTGSITNPTFLFALNSDGAGVWQPDATNANNSALPQGLTDGVNAPALNEADNGFYNGITTGSVRIYFPQYQRLLIGQPMMPEQVMILEIMDQIHSPFRHLLSISIVLSCNQSFTNNFWNNWRNIYCL